jgi:hypothetical protein
MGDAVGRQLIGLVEFEVHVRRAVRLLHSTPEQVQEAIAWPVVFEVDAEVEQVALLVRDLPAHYGRDGRVLLRALAERVVVRAGGCVGLACFGDAGPVDRRATAVDDQVSVVDLEVAAGQARR